MKNKNLYLYNEGELSILDLTTMGDSSKRNDPNTIGKFDSGLKYAIAILLRNDIEFFINSGGDIYTFSKCVVRDDKTGKVKGLINVIVNGTETYQTAFAVQLGHNWEFWMAIRELYSNCLDMKGSYKISELDAIPNPILDVKTTFIKITGHPLLTPILKNWGNYFNEATPILSDYNVKVYPNTGDHLKIYKQGILVYEDIDKKSRFIYEIPKASIDERRVANCLMDIYGDIAYTFCSCKDPEFIKKYFINIDEEESLESGLYYCYGLSSSWVKVVNEYCTENENFTSYFEILENIQKDKRFKTGTRKILSVMKTRNTATKVVEVNLEEEIKITWEDSIKNICLKEGFDVSYPLLKSQIDSHKCIADTADKIIYVDEKFNSEDVWEIVREQYKIDSQKDPDKIYKDFLKRKKNNENNFF